MHICIYILTFNLNALCWIVWKKKLNIAEYFPNVGNINIKFNLIRIKKQEVKKFNCFVLKSKLHTF